MRLVTSRFWRVKCFLWNIHGKCWLWEFLPLPFWKIIKSHYWSFGSIRTCHNLIICWHIMDVNIPFWEDLISEKTTHWVGLLHVHLTTCWKTCKSKYFTLVPWKNNQKILFLDSRTPTDKLMQFNCYTLTLRFICSTLISLHFLQKWQGEFVWKSWAPWIGDNFCYSHDLYIWFKGDTVRRN